MLKTYIQKKISICILLNNTFLNTITFVIYIYIYITNMKNIKYELTQKV